MVRKAIIVVRLVQESVETTKEEIEKIIAEELSESPVKIPYLEVVESVKVKEES